MTPKMHRVALIVMMLGSFVGVAGVAWLMFGLGESYWFLLRPAAGFLAVFASSVVWRRLIPVRCPKCGTRCRLFDEPARSDQDEGDQRWVTRYYCPKCKYNL